MRVYASRSKPPSQPKPTWQNCSEIKTNFVTKAGSDVVLLPISSKPNHPLKKFTYYLTEEREKALPQIEERTRSLIIFDFFTTRRAWLNNEARAQKNKILILHYMIVVFII